MMLLQKRGAPAELLPEFLKEVYLGQRTGLLHVTAADEVRVSFRAVNGEIVSGSSSQERGRFGESLVRRRLLKRAELERALAVVAGERRRLAPVLRELGLVDRLTLERALALHIREMLLTALEWEDAWLLFEDQELPDAPAEDLTLRCSTAELILDMVRRIAPGAVRKALGRLERLVVAVDQPPFRLERVGATESDRYVLARADGTRSARSLIDAGKLPPEHVEGSLLGLLLTGAIRLVPPGGPSTGPSPQQAPPIRPASRR